MVARLGAGAAGPPPSGQPREDASFAFRPVVLPAGFVDKVNGRHAIVPNVDEVRRLALAARSGSAVRCLGLLEDLAGDASKQDLACAVLAQPDVRAALGQIATQLTGPRLEARLIKLAAFPARYLSSR
jgi:hypothetical protein